MDDMEVLGLSLFPFLKVSRYVDPASRIDITECHSRLRWLQNYDIPCSPLLSKKFYILQMVHTHTLPQEGEKIRSRPWDENEEEGKWKWGEDDNEMKVT